MRVAGEGHAARFLEGSRPGCVGPCLQDGVLGRGTALIGEGDEAEDLVPHGGTDHALSHLVDCPGGIRTSRRG